MSSNPTTSTGTVNRRTTWVVIGIVGLILIALLVTVLSTKSSSDTDALDDGVTTSVPSGEPVEQSRTVTVTGDKLVSLENANTDPAVGVLAPTLAGQSFDGTSVSIEPGDGQPYMVVFLAHWCPHCNAEIPRLVEWFESGRVPKNLRVVGVSTAVSAERPNYPPSEWITKTKWPWQTMADSADLTAASAYGVSGFPFFVIVGADGEVKVRRSGEVDIQTLEQIVETALAG